MGTIEKYQGKYQRSRLDNAISTAISVGISSVCGAWTASIYAKNAWRSLAQNPGMY